MKRFLLLFCILSLPAQAAIESRQFADSEQQAVYERLTNELRCLVCQNQTIADSNAELAADLRRQVYEMLEKGQSRDDIVRFMTERYGDFVLYNPPFKAKTGLLWLGPILFLFAGLMTGFWVIKRKKANDPSKTDTAQAEQQAKIRHLLDSGDPS